MNTTLTKYRSDPHLVYDWLKDTNPTTFTVNDIISSVRRDDGSKMPYSGASGAVSTMIIRKMVTKTGKFEPGKRQHQLRQVYAWAGVPEGYTPSFNDLTPSNHAKRAKGQPLRVFAATGEAKQPRPVHKVHKDGQLLSDRLLSLAAEVAALESKEPAPADLATLSSDQLMAELFGRMGKKASVRG